MTERFVVDFRIAATEWGNLLTPGWRWPVPQAAYDEPLREFVEWAYTLPAELPHDEQLRNAFGLVEIAMMKDLIAALGVWVDVSASRQQNLHLVHGSNQLLYRMFLEDQFSEYSVFDGPRAARYGTARSRIGRASRRLRRKFGMDKIRGPRAVISPNQLTNEIVPAGTPSFRVDPTELRRNRLKNQDVLGNVAELAITIADRVGAVFSNRDQQLTANATEFILGTISRHLAHGMADQELKLPVHGNLNTLHVYVGTGASYGSRLASHLVHREGGTVTRSTHGGESMFFEDPFWVGSELPMITNYVTYGANLATLITNTIATHPRARALTEAPRVSAVGSSYHRQLVQRSTPSISAKAPTNIAVISAAFTGERRAAPHTMNQDVVYMEWHGRLLQALKTAGFYVISKRHPKGMLSETPLFGDFCENEIIGVPMNQLQEQVEAFVLDVAGGAFMEAMCSMKPVVLIHIPNRRMTEQGRTIIQESAEIVVARFDDRNRVTVDNRELVDAIRRPVDVAARKQFIGDYLLDSSEPVSTG